MELTLDIFLYEFQNLGATCVHRSPKMHPLTGARQFYLYGQKHGSPLGIYLETAPENLYIAELSALWNARTYMTDEMTVLATADIPLSEEDLACIPGTLMLVDPQYETPYLLNRAFQVFESFSKWDKDTHIATLEGKSMQELLDMSEELIACPVLIFDSSFDVLACSGMENCRYKNFIETIQQGYTDSKTMHLVKNQAVFSKLDHTALLSAPAATESDKHMVYIRFSSGQNTLGYASIYTETTIPSQGYLDILTIFAQNMNLCFKRDFEQIHYGKMMYETFLLNLLHADSISEKQLEDQLANMEDLERYGTFVLGVFQFTPKTSVPKSFIARMLTREFSDVHVFLNDSHICLLRSYQDLRLPALTEQEYQNMQHLLINYQYTFGMSNIFSDLMELRFAYRQACFALSMSSRSDNTIYLYSDFLYEDLFSTLGKEMPLSMLKCKEYICLQNYDTQHKTNYCTILLTYLEQDCNATHAANTLYLHRNTIRKAVAFAEEQLNIHLSDSKVKQSLLLSKKLDDYLAATK